MRVAAALFGLLALATASHAETVMLRSFSYRSTGCYSGGDLLTFGGTDSYKMTDAAPGAGSLPPGNFWIRAVSVTFFGSSRNQYAVLGHSGDNGDWISSPVLSGASVFLSFPSNAAPLFTAGEYLDVHAGCSRWSWFHRDWAFVSIWYTPAP